MENNTVLITLLAGIPATLAAVVALVLGLRASKKVNTVTNGNLAEVKAALEVINNKLTVLLIRS